MVGSRSLFASFPSVFFWPFWRSRGGRTCTCSNHRPSLGERAVSRCITPENLSVLCRVYPGAEQSNLQRTTFREKLSEKPRLTNGSKKSPISQPEVGNKEALRYSSQGEQQTEGQRVELQPGLHGTRLHLRVGPSGRRAYLRKSSSPQR